MSDMPTQFLTVEQVADILSVSVNTVARQFAQLPGTIDLGTTEKMNRRRKRCLHIPRTTLQRFIESRQTKRSK